MPSASGEPVVNRPVAFQLMKRDYPPMNQRFAEPFIGVVLGIENVFRSCALPSIYSRPDVWSQREEAASDDGRDFCSIDLHRVVIGGGAKRVSPGFAARINVRAGVSQKRVAIGLQLERQCVRMSV